MKTSHAIIFSGLALAALFFGTYCTWRSSADRLHEEDLHAVRIGETAVRVRIADTPKLQERGLSGTPSLEEDEGMLFVFDHPEQYRFWMKDMLMPLDIIWIGPDLRIVDISREVEPDTYPATFSPKEPSQYVLEVNSGFSERHGLEEGDTLSLE